MQNESIKIFREFTNDSEFTDQDILGLLEQRSNDL